MLAAKEYMHFSNNVYILSFFVWLRKHHLLEKVISARSAGFSFLKNENMMIVR